MFITACKKIVSPYICVFKHEILWYLRHEIRAACHIGLAVRKLN